MREKFTERRAAMIDFNTRLTLKMVIEIVILTVVITGSWFAVNYELKDLRRELQELNQRVEKIANDKWPPVKDYLFMEAYSQTNGLMMVPHPGESD